MSPDLPAELYDALESVLGQPLLRSDVVEVVDPGAGAGATRGATHGLRGRGARVRTVERPTPPRPLPVPDESVDLVCLPAACDGVWPADHLAQLVPEALRVLRPRGVLATWGAAPDGSPEPTARAWLAAHGLLVAHVRLPWARPGGSGGHDGDGLVLHLVAGTRPTRAVQA